MTEPPEPRRPEEDGGEDDPGWDEMERNAARDFVADNTPDMQEAIDAARAEMGDEAFDAAVEEVLRRANAPRDDVPDGDIPFGDPDEPIDWDVWDDDVLLDQLGNKEPIEEGDETGELRDMLGNWRDDVDSEPVGPIAENAQEIHNLNKKFELPEAQPDTGGTPSMAISEDAPVIRQVAESQAAAGAVQLAQTNIGEVSINVDRLADAVGTLQEGAAGIESDAAAAAAAAGGAEGDTINGAGQAAARAFNDAQQAVEQARLKADELSAAMQAAGAALDSALAADQQFRQTCGDVAGRHGA
jgi:hypothetical protein